MVCTLRPNRAASRAQLVRYVGDEMWTEQYDLCRLSTADRARISKHALALATAVASAAPVSIEAAPPIIPRPRPRTVVDGLRDVAECADAAAADAERKAAAAAARRKKRRRKGV